MVIERAYAGSGASCRNVGRVRSIQLTPELTRVGLAALAKHGRLGKELGQNTLFWRAGYMWVLYSEAEVERFRALLPMLAEERCPAKLLSCEKTLKHMPVLEGGERPAGAMYGARDVIVHHDAVIYAYRNACTKLGVELHEHTEVTAIETANGRASVVQCGQKRFEADIVVVAAGGWSSKVSQLAGVSIPNTPYRREAFVTESAKPFMSAAVTFYSPTEGWFNQTLRGELVAGSVSESELGGLNHSASSGSVELTGSLLMQKAPLLAGLRVVRQWAGVYDMTPDRKPLVGQSRVPGLYQFNGCNGRGFNLGPVLAQLLAEEITTGRRSDLLKGFEANRFDGSDAKVAMGDYYAGYGTSGAEQPRSALIKLVH